MGIVYLEGQNSKQTYYYQGFKSCNIEEKMKENHLRWFRDVQRLGINELVKRLKVGA